MNYGDLKTAVASDSHRDDLIAEIPRFIREAEGMIRRELVALSFTDTIDETDRVADGVYTLPAYLQVIRSIHYYNDVVSKVGLDQLRAISAKARPVWYAERGSNRIEFRGIPGDDSIFEIEYIGHPAPLVDDADENDLLTDHESLYVNGALFYLYQHTQDNELAQARLSSFTNIVSKLNEQFGRKYGGAATAGAYNLYGGESSY